MASYNALLTLGDGRSFDEVLSYYNGKMLFTPGNGLIGLLPFHVADYFRELGYSVVVTDDIDFIDILSSDADASIMFYMFPREYTVSFVSIDAFGAHFVEYHKKGNGYSGMNTNGNNGRSEFNSPSVFGYNASRFYAVGIFIYK